MQIKSAQAPNPYASPQECEPELKAGGTKAGGTKAAQSPLVAFIVHIGKLLGFGLAVLFIVFIAGLVASSFMFSGGID